MRFVTYILRSVNLLNLILVAVAALLATYALYPLATVKATFKSPAVEPASAVQEEKPAAGQSPTPSEYVIVAEQNLFHPERKIPVEKTAEAQARPDIILYGTLIADDMRVAYIEDRRAPQMSPGRGARQTAVKQGQAVSGFLLKSVETDRIVLARGEDQITVYLTDARKTRAPATSPQPGVAQPATRPGLATPAQPILRPGTPAGSSAAPAAGPTAPSVLPPAPAIPSRQQRSEAIRSQTGAQAPAATGQNAATPATPQQGR